MIGKHGSDRVQRIMDEYVEKCGTDEDKKKKVIKAFEFIFSHNKSQL